MLFRLISITPVLKHIQFFHYFIFILTLHHQVNFTGLFHSLCQGHYLSIKPELVLILTFEKYNFGLPLPV